MSPAEFFSLYTVSGLAASLASAPINRAISGQVVPGLGASGAVFAVASYLMLSEPQSQWRFFFVIPATGQQLYWGLLAMNAVLMVPAVAARLRLDGGAHLVGTAIGSVYYMMRKRAAAARKQGN